MADARYLRLHGHESIRNRLRLAIESARLPQSLLFHGRRGIGKQRLALWVAAAVNCRGNAPRPCGECHSCHLAGRLEHPDIHWFFPLSRPKGASSPEALERKLEDHRSAVLQDRRANPYSLDEEEGATGIYVAAVHTIRRLAQKTPAMGPSKIFVIGRAEALVPQAASPEAANALLKLLEEPPADTVLILTSDVPGALLPTVRSRVQALRVTPLADGDVSDFLEAEFSMSSEAATRLAARSGGSIGRALELNDGEDDRMRTEAIELASAALASRYSAHLAAAHRYPSFGARGNFARLLNQTSQVLRDLLAESMGATPSDREALSALPGGRSANPKVIVEILDALDEAHNLAERNVNPQLIVISILRSGRVSLGGPSGHQGVQETSQ